MRHADYAIVKTTPDIVFIKDLDLGGKSVTNNAEFVVAQIHEQHPHRRVVYKDSNGDWDELVHDEGVFLHFAPYHGDHP